MRRPAARAAQAGPGEGAGGQAVPRRKPVRLKRASSAPQTIDRIRARYVKRLNDLHVGAQITVTALQLQLDDLARSPARVRYFVVPSSGGQPTANIKRDPRGMRELLQNLIEQDEYAKSLLSAISITEDFVANVLRLAHRAFPDRLLRGRRNGEAVATVDLKDVIGRTTDQVLDGVVQQRLARLMLGSPRDYLRYARDSFGIELDAAIVAAFAEVKATRDVIVHASGTTDERYVQKAGDLARVAAGETLRVERPYFDQAIATMKVLVATFSAELTARHGENRRFLEVVANAT